MSNSFESNESDLLDGQTIRVERVDQLKLQPRDLSRRANVLSSFVMMLVDDAAVLLVLIALPATRPHSSQRHSN